jgi:hypothetical protein
MGSFRAASPARLPVWQPSPRRRASDSDVDLAVLHWLPPKLVRECQGDRDVAHMLMGGQRNGWREAFEGAFSVPVQLELNALGDRMIRAGLKRSRILLYRQTASDL